MLPHNYYLGSEWYMENFIIADTKESYRVGCTGEDRETPDATVRNEG